jgi:hypothetical protein
MSKRPKKRASYSQYVAGFMGVLAETTARDRDLRELRGKAMECVSCIADAVGNEVRLSLLFCFYSHVQFLLNSLRTPLQVFGADAPRVMELLMSGHRGQIDPEDPQVCVCALFFVCNTRGSIWLT